MHAHKHTMCTLKIGEKSLKHSLAICAHAQHFYIKSLSYSILLAILYSVIYRWGEILKDLMLCWQSIKIIPVNIFHQQ